MPFSRILRMRGTWAFAIAYALTAPVFWFYLYWLPPFLNQQYNLGINVTQMGIPLIIIYLTADFGSVGGGILSSFLIGRGMNSIKARLLSMLLFACCIVGVIMAAGSSQLWVAVFAISLAIGAHQAWTANIWSLVMDYTPKHMMSTVFGFGGMCAAIGGMFMTQIVGHILTVTNNNYTVLFTLIPAMYFIALTWMYFMAPRKIPTGRRLIQRRRCCQAAANPLMQITPMPDHRGQVGGMAEHQPAQQPRKHDLAIAERRQQGRRREAEGLGQQQVRGHPAGAQRQHQHAVPQGWHLPEERHHRTHHQGIAQAGEEVAGGGRVVLAEDAREQLVEAEEQCRAQRQQHRRGEQFTARVDDHQHPDKPADHRQPLATRHVFTEQGHRQRRHQDRCEEVHCGGFRQRDVMQRGGKKQAGAQQAQGPHHLHPWPLAAQHAQARLRQENPGHQQGMHQVARPHHHHDRVEPGQEFGQGVVAGEQKSRHHNQQNAFEGMVDAGKWGADSH